MRQANMKLLIILILYSITVCKANLTGNIHFKSPLDSLKYDWVAKNLTTSDIGTQSVIGKVANGVRAVQGQFPYQVFIYSYDFNGNGYICGGTIIDKRWILTAAHCLDENIRVEVHFGGINRVSFLEGGYIRRDVVTHGRSIIVHQNFNSSTLENDIGLLELPGEAPLDNQYVGTIKLSTGDNVPRNLENIEGTVSGFGRLSDDTSSNYLMFAKITIADNSLCRQTFIAPVTDNHICLNSYSSSPCPGDSGGPLTVEGLNGEVVQVGIVSFGANSCTRGYPSVFTKVEKYITWIENTTGVKFA